MTRRITGINPFSCALWAKGGRSTWAGYNLVGSATDFGGVGCPGYEFIGIPYLGWTCGGSISADAVGVAVLSAASHEGKVAFPCTRSILSLRSRMRLESLDSWSATIFCTSCIVRVGDPKVLPREVLTAGSTTRNLVIYDRFLVTYIENVTISPWIQTNPMPSPLGGDVSPKRHKLLDKTSLTHQVVTIW